MASDSLLLAVDAAIARVAAELASGDPGAATKGMPRADLEASLRDLRRLHGARMLWMTRFADGTRELEALLRDPALSPELRQRVNLDLAQNYAYPPRAVHFSWPQSDSEYRVAIVYASEGLDRLSAALDAGCSDWDWIEEHLEALREHPGYVALSLRHNRMPPRDEEED